MLYLVQKTSFTYIFYLLADACRNAEASCWNVCGIPAGNPEFVSGLFNTFMGDLLIKMMKSFKYSPTIVV